MLDTTLNNEILVQKDTHIPDAIINVIQSYENKIQSLIESKSTKDNV